MTPEFLIRFNTSVLTLLLLLFNPAIVRQSECEKACGRGCCFDLGESGGVKFEQFFSQLSALFG